MIPIQPLELSAICHRLTSPETLRFDDILYTRQTWYNTKRRICRVSIYYVQWSRILSTCSQKLASHSRNRVYRDGKATNHPKLNFRIPRKANNRSTKSRSEELKQRENSNLSNTPLNASGANAKRSHKTNHADANADADADADSNAKRKHLSARLSKKDKRKEMKWKPQVCD